MRWLHVSDIHFGYETETVRKMREGFLEEIENQGTFDAIFITGDLRFAKNSPNDYPKETLKFIQDIQKKTGVLKENTFIVPGNHDVNRNDALSAIISMEMGKYSTEKGGLGDTSLNIAKMFKSDFYSIAEECSNIKKDSWHYFLERFGFNIICLDSSILCGSDRDDGNLILDSKKIGELLASLPNDKASIVLAHHDFGSYKIDEQKYLEIELKRAGACLYLCGHKHVAGYRNQSEYEHIHDLTVFIAGTGMDKSSGIDYTDMNYYIGELDADSLIGKMESFKWDKSNYLWIPDYSMYRMSGYSKETFIPLDLSKKKSDELKNTRTIPSEKSKETREEAFAEIIDKYQRFISSQCSEIELNGLPILSADMVKSHKIQELYVPVSFSPSIIGIETFEFNFEDIDTEGVDIDLDKYIEDYEIAQVEDALSDFSNYYEYKDRTIDTLIPENESFRYCILSKPGGGKTTLLKLLASYYGVAENRKFIKTKLTERDLFPVWIRCRQFREGSGTTVWDAISNIAREAEWADRERDAETFRILVQNKMSEGKLLLLIDGLDEIGDLKEREQFAEAVSLFADNNPKANIIVTSRPTGFRDINQGILKKYEVLEINDLDDDSIKELSINWHRAICGNSEQVEQQAYDLADEIIRKEQIHQLAKNPLLMTTLLLVSRRRGNIPTQRVSLYSEAVRVLLDTWNSVANKKYSVNYDEAIYQLAYVAFYMMIQEPRLTQIYRKNLKNQLTKVRKEYDDLISDRDSALKFISNVEYRSGLLVQVGRKIPENEVEIQEVYEFQHLTFQEYLAALAIKEGCIPTDKAVDYVDELISRYTDPNLEETILLAASMKNDFARKLVEKILVDVAGGCESETSMFLLKLLADGALISTELTKRVLDSVFSKGISAAMIPYLFNIYEGKHFKTVHTFIQNGGKSGSIFFQVLDEIFTGKEKTPIERFIVSAKSEDINEVRLGYWYLFAGVFVQGGKTLYTEDDLEKALAVFYKTDMSDDYICSRAVVDMLAYRRYLFVRSFSQLSFCYKYLLRYLISCDEVKNSILPLVFRDYVPDSMDEMEDNSISVPFDVLGKLQKMKTKEDNMSLLVNYMYAILLADSEPELVRGIVELYISKGSFVYWKSRSQFLSKILCSTKIPQYKKDRFRFYVLYVESKLRTIKPNIAEVDTILGLNLTVENRNGRARREEYERRIAEELEKIELK